MLALLMMPAALKAQETLTVFDGTTINSHVPVYGLYTDEYQKCEFVIPASQLQTMTNGAIGNMTFYLSNPASAAWTGTFRVYLREVSETAISSYYGTDGATVVYQGTLDGTGTTMEVPFTQAYSYNGGNLLVGFNVITPGNYSSAAFYGTSVSTSSISGYNSNDLASVSANPWNFIPKTTFTYTPPIGSPLTVTVGTGTGTSYKAPFYTAFSYSLEESIYLASEIGMSSGGTIQSISYNMSSTDPTTNHITIFMKNVSRSGFNSQTDYETLSSEDLVCEGTYTFQNGWNTITLDVPFEYNGTDNLMIAVHEDSPGSSTRYFHHSYINNTVHTITYNSRNPNPYNLAAEDPSQQQTGNERANIRLSIIPKTVEIVSGTTSSNYFCPVNTFYNYSLVQQLYTSEEIGVPNGGDIHSVSFYCSNLPSTFTMSDIRMYLKNTNKNAFSGPTDMVSISATDMVWHDDFTVTMPGWVTLTLSAPFHYTGGNLLLCMYDTIIGYPGDTYTFLGSATPDTSCITYYSDGTRPMLSDIHSFAGNRGRARYHSVVRFGITPDPCPVPANLASTALSPTEANLSWTGSHSEYTVRYRPTTAYLTEDFENCGSALPAGWSSLSSIGSNQWNVGTGDFHQTTGSASWNHNAIIIHSSRGDETYLITPEMDLSGATNPVLNFWLINRDWSSDIDEVGVYYRVNGGSWQPLYYTTEEHPDWTSMSVPLGGAAANYQVAFKMYDNWGYGVGIDHVEVLEAGSNWTTVSPASNPLHLSGLTPGQDYEWQVRGNCGINYSEWFSNVYSANPTIQSTANWYGFSGSNTDHSVLENKFLSFTVQNPESATIASDSIPGNPFTFAAAYANGYVWCVSYAFPRNLYRAVLDNSNKTISPLETIVPEFETSIVSAMCYNPDNDYIYFLTWDNKLKRFHPSTPSTVTEIGSLPLSNPAVCFAINNSGTAYIIEAYTGDLYLLDLSNTDITFVGSTGYNPESTIQGLAFDLETNELFWSRKNSSDNGLYLLDPGTASSSFLGIIGGGSGARVQGLFMGDNSMMACMAPTGLTVSDLHSDGATLSWNGTESDYQIAIGTSPDISSPSFTTSGNTATLSGLSPETTYYAKVRTVCGSSNYSYWSGIVSFTTLPACSAPTNLTANVNILTFDAALLLWTETGTATSWVVEYGTVPDFSDAVTEITNSENLYLPYLTPGTTYYARVRSDCGSSTESVWSEPLRFVCASETYIGSGTNSDVYLPSHSYYRYGMSQQIYTPDEVGAAGTITGISFYNNGTTTTRIYDMYLLHTDKESFSDEKDWVSVIPSQRVFSGAVTMTTYEWNNFELETPFEYNGTDNLLLVMVDNTGSYIVSPHMSCLVFDAPGKALIDYTDVTSYYPTHANSYVGIRKDVKNRILIYKLPAPDCPKPENFTVSDIGITKAVLNWTESGSATQWQVCVNGDESNLITVTEPTVTLTGLTLSSYTAKVRSVCGGSAGVSNWTAEVSFTVHGCESPMGITGEGTFDGTAEISWPGHDDSFTLRYRLFGGDTWTTLPDVTGNSITLTGLTPGKYEVRVESHCAPGGWASSTFIIPEILSTADWYGYAIDNASGQPWESQFIHFTMQDPATVTQATNGLPYDYTYNATYADGYVWCITTDGSLTKAAVDNDLHTISDFETVVPNFDMGYVVSTSYNPVDGKIYYLETLSDYFLKSFDPANPSSTPTTNGALNAIYPNAIAINRNGEAYVLNEDGYLFHLNPNDLSYNLVGYTDIPENYYFQSLAFDMYTDELFWAQRNNYDIALYKVDPATAKTWYMGQIGGGVQIVGLFMGDPGCVAPTDLEATIHPDDLTTADLAWTENGPASSWVVEYGTASDFSDAVSVTVSTESCHLTGLTPETTYFARVKADCGSGVESSWSATVSFTPSLYTYSCEGTATDYDLPTTTAYRYSLSQQIYTPDDLGAEGLIESIGFYNTSSAINRKIDIYMTHTPKNNFTGSYGWETVAADNLVFSGTVAFGEDSWTDILLDNPFVYNGVENVILVVDDNTGSYSYDDTYFKVCDAPDQALCIGGDYSIYDPTNIGSTYGYVKNVKNQIRIIKSEIPTCFRPTFPSVSQIGTNSATLSWNENGGATAWNVYYKKEGDVDFTLLAGITSNPYILTGLEPASHYEFYVESVCSSTDISVPSHTLSFVTKCEAVGIPYDYDFEAEEPLECWTAVSGNMTRQCCSSHDPDGVYMLKFSGSTSNLLALPQFTEEVANLQISFWTYPVKYGSVTDGGTFSVGYITDLDDPSTFTAVNTYQYLNWNTGFQQKTEYFESAPVGSYIAFRHNPTLPSLEWYVDEVVVSMAPACHVPNELTVSPYINSATLGWNPRSGESEWTIHYKAASDDMFTELTGISNSNYVLTGLSANTTYQYYVQAVCSATESSTPSDTVSFTTLCGEFTIPYFDDFETASNIPCWVSAGGPGSGIFRTTEGNNTPGGSYAAGLGGEPSSHVRTVALPAFDEEISNLQLSFWLKPGDYTYSSAGSFDVGYMTNINISSTYHSVAHYDRTDWTSEDFVLKTEYFTGAPAGSRIVLKHDFSTVNHYWYFDDVKVSTYTCKVPDNLTATGVTTNSANLSWTPKGSETTWNLYYKKRLDATYIEISGLNSTSYTLTGLESGTIYEFYVTAVCSATESSDPSSVCMFGTECGGAVALPYSYDFETHDPYICWNPITGVEVDNANYYNHTLGGHFSLRFTGDAPVADLVALPQFEEEISNLRISFYARPMSNSDSRCGYLTVGYMTDLSDPASFVPVHEYSYSDWPSSNYVQKTDYFTGAPAGAYIAFRRHSIPADPSVYWNMDDVQVTWADACQVPDGLTASNLTPNSAMLSWNANSSESEWVLYYKKSTDATYTEVNGVTENPYTLQNLEPGTSYSFSVKAVCSTTDISFMSEVFNFTTPCEMVAIPYSYDFEDPAPFVCWHTNGWAARGSSYVNHTEDGQYYMYLGGTTAAHVVAFPQFDEEINNLRLSFWIRPESFINDYCGTFTVGYLTDLNDPTTFVAVNTYSYAEWSNLQYVQKTVLFSDAPDGSTIAFHVESNLSYYYWLVDDVEVTRLCPAPENLIVSNFTNTSATASWTGTADSYTLRYKPVSGDWITVTDITDTFYLIDGLNPGDYEVEVAASCDETNTISATFNIMEVLSTANWYGYAKNTYSTYDWERKFISFSMQDPTMVTAATGELYIGTYSYTDVAAYADGYVWSINYNGDLVKARLDNANQTISTFETVVLGYNETPHMMSYNPADGRIYFAHGSNDLMSFSPENPADILEIGHINQNFKTFAINSSGEAYGIMGTGDLYQINLSDASATLVGNTGIDLDYAQSMAFDFETGELFWAQCYGSDDAALYLVNPATAQVQYVGKLGGAGVTQLVGLFMGSDYCFAPENLTVTNIATNSATLGWESDATSWSIMLDETVLSGITNNPYVFTGLLPGTEHTVKVRAHCEGIGESDWSEPVTFTTNPSIIPSYVTITGTTAVCPGSTTVLTVTTDVEATYLWSTGATSASVTVGVGEYSVTVTSTTGNELSETVTVEELPTYNTPITHVMCQGDSYDFFGEVLTETGVYSDTLQTVNGCDSVVTLTLTVNPVYEMLESREVCPAAMPYEWNGVTFNEAGTQTATLQTVNGCDSVVIMTVTVNEAYNTTEERAVCITELPYEWNGETFTEAGTQTATLTAANGCDSVVTMILAVHSTYNVTDEAIICQSAMPYEWNGVTFTEAGTQTATLQSVHGCDSVVTLTLTVNPTYNVTDEAIICQSELPYEWNSVTFTEAGTQTATLPTVNGCDSVVTMTLTVNLTYNVTDEATICQSELPYEWNGVTFTEAGTQTATLQTVNGCDSVVTMTLTVNPTYNVTDEAIICQSALPYEWNGETFTEVGTQTATLPIVNGCDSVVTMTLTVNPTYNVTDDTTICQSALPYEWNGVTFTEAGTQTATLQTVNGCDSVVTMTLTVNPTYNVTDEATICQSALPYEWNGETFTEAGTQTATLPTVNGCDSVVTMTLTVNPTYNVTDEAIICQSALPYEWNGVTFTEAGTQTATLPTVNGCDSVVTMTLTVLPTFAVTDNRAVCVTQLPYEWNGVTFTAAGTQTATLQAVNGCDSVVTMTLAVNYPQMVSVSDTICQSELPYEWNGVTFTTAGSQLATLPATNGCDSMITMTLIVNPTYNETEDAIICESELPYEWNGVTFTEAGTQTVTLQTVNGCDSVLTLHLTVNYADTAEFAETVCDSYEWNDQTYTVSGDYTQTFTNAAGCDSVVTLHLTVNYAETAEFAETVCDSFTWNGTAYTESGDYTSYLTNAAGCDSVVTLHLTINYSTTGDTTAVACDSFTWYGETYTESGDYTSYMTNANGCDSVVTLHLTINSSTTGDTTAVACDSFTWYGETYTESGDYTSYLTNAAGCDSVVTLHLTINSSTTGDTTAVACDSFTWYGETYTESGDYTSYLTNATGCDSVVTLHLTVNYSSTGDTTAVACDSFTWYDSTYTVSGDYTSYLTNASGCDSVVTLHLTINSTTTGDTTAVACDSFTWYDSTYTVSGDYTSYLTNANGCDSVVTLHLTINSTTTGDTTAVACDSFTWYGETYTETGDYTSYLTNANGCDSVVTLHLTINNSTTGDTTAVACDSFTWYGETYTESGDYTSYLTNATGCDSVVTLHLTINNSTTGDTTAVACDSFTWYGNTYTESGDYTSYFTTAAGCDSVVILHLTVNHPVTSEFTIETSDSCYDWNGVLYCASGDYTQTLTAANGCDSVVTLHLTTSVGIENHEASALYLAPNPTKNVSRIYGVGESLKSAEIFDMRGRLITKVYDNEIDVTTLPTGVYLVKVYTDKGVTNLKLVKQ